MCDLALAALVAGACGSSGAFAQGPDFEPLGDLTGGSFESKAWAVSGDGSTVVGESNSTNGDEAFRWTSGTDMVGLCDLAGGVFNSVAFGVSADGSVVVGWGSEGGVATATAYRWTSGTGMVVLGDLPGGGTNSQAFDVSADGSVVVGGGLSTGGNEVFRCVRGQVIWNQMGT